MNRWKVILSSTAKRDIRNMDDGPRRDANDLVEDLAEDPYRVPGAIELRANAGIYRARFYRNAYRMIYRVSDSQRKVFVLRAKPRGVVYKGLKNPSG